MTGVEPEYSGIEFISKDVGVTLIKINFDVDVPYT